MVVVSITVPLHPACKTCNYIHYMLNYMLPMMLMHFRLAFDGNGLWAQEWRRHVLPTPSDPWNRVFQLLQRPLKMCTNSRAFKLAMRQKKSAIHAVSSSEPESCCYSSSSSPNVFTVRPHAWSETTYFISMHKQNLVLISLNNCGIVSEWASEPA